MAGFDKSKDEVLGVEVVGKGEPEWIEVVLARYAGGQAKVGIVRCCERGGEKQYRRLRRMSLDEVENVVSALRRMVRIGRAGKP